MHRSLAFLFVACLAVAAPARAADQIHWTFTGPTSVSFDWRGSETAIRYGLTTSYGTTVTAQTPSPLPFSSSGPWREARLTGLLPNTTYHYSIGNGPDHTFRTLPGPNATFTVFVQGDIGAAMDYPRVAGVQSLIAAGQPAFVIAVGDLTYGNARGQDAVDAHFNDVMVWSQDAAYLPVWGNHEWDDTTDDLRNYKGRFEFPNPQTSPGAPTAGCCGEDWYWFDAGGVRFIAYPEPYSGAWADWSARADALMDQAQADAAIRFIVTFGHRPAYSSGHHPGSTTLRNYLDALGASHPKYVLNINGHSHNYERTTPRNGVTHVTAGIGGSTLERESGACPYLGGCPAPSWSAFRAFHHGAVKLTVTPASLRVQAICGPAGDSGSNQNDIACSPGDVFDDHLIALPGTVDATAPEPSVAFAIERVSPNPSTGALQLAFALPGSEPASLELVDVTGRIVMRHDLGVPGAGPHRVTLARDPSLPAGTYWLRLRQAARSTASKVIFVR